MNRALHLAAGLATLVSAERGLAHQDAAPEATPPVPALKSENLTPGETPRAVNYQSSDFAKALYEVDLRFGATADDVRSAEAQIIKTIDLVRAAFDELPSNADTDTKLRAMHRVIRAEFGAGVPSQSSYAKGIAEKTPDCDVFCLIFHEVGEAVGMPMRVYAIDHINATDHAIVSHGDGNDLRIIEPRTDADSGGQVLLPSLAMGVAQFAAAQGQDFLRYDIYEVNGPKLAGMSLSERLGKFPADRNNPTEFARIVDKGTQMLRAEMDQKSLRELCQIAIASGELTSEEREFLEDVVAHRDRVYPEIATLFPELYDCIFWTQGAAAAEATNGPRRAALMAHSQEVAARVAPIQSGVQALNNTFNQSNFPFTAKIGTFSDGQLDSLYGITFTSKTSGTEHGFENIQGIHLNHGEAGGRSLEVTVPAGVFIFNEDGSLSKK